MLFIWQILVPCVYNTGKPVRTRHHREWDKRVRKITGGLTILPPVRGQWVDPKTKILYEERMIPVQIICTQPQIQKIAEMTSLHYDQLAIMYFKMSDQAVIYEREPRNA